MRAVLYCLLLLVLLFTIVFVSFKAGENNYRNKIRAAAGLDSLKLEELRLMDSLHLAQAQMWEFKAKAEERDRIQSEQNYAAQLAKLRNQPQRLVLVPEVKIIECDSAIASGQSFQREVEIQKMQIRELKEVATVRQSRLDTLEFSLERAEQQNIDNAELLQKEKRFSSKETKRKVFWRTTTLILAVERIVSLI